MAPETKATPSGKAGGGTNRHEQPRSFEAAFAAAGVPPADAHNLDLGDMKIPYVWKAHRIAAACDPLTKAAQSAAEAKGFDLFQLPADPATGLPADFLTAFG